MPSLLKPLMVSFMYEKAPVGVDPELASAPYAPQPWQIERGYETVIFEGVPAITQAPQFEHIKAAIVEMARDRFDIHYSKITILNFQRLEDTGDATRKIERVY